MLWDRIKQQDLLLTIIVILLSLFGLLAVFTTTFYFEEAIQQNFGKQILFFVIGYCIYFLVMGINKDWLKQPHIQLFLYVANLALLILLLVAGETIAGTKRWIDVGFISIQPAEFTKIIVILGMAAIFRQLPETQLHNDNRKYIRLKLGPWHIRLHRRMCQTIRFYGSKILLSFIIVLPPSILILLQPSLGNALIVLMIWFLLIASLIKKPLKLALYGIIALAGFNLSANLIPLEILGDHPAHILFSIYLILALVVILMRRWLHINLKLLPVLIVAGLIAGSLINIGWNTVLNDYQKERVVAFLNPEADPQGSGWQVSRARLAIASAPVPFGFGLLQGPQVYTNYLPFPYTDFVYAAITEQTGIFGAGLLVLLYIFLLLRILHLADESKDQFSRVVIIGVALMIGINIIINIGMNQGLMPVTGVPLPLVSYGGSSVLSTLLGLGLVQAVYTESISTNIHRWKKR